MSNIAKVLKGEIRRLAKSEAKAATAPLRKTIVALRNAVRSLKTENADLAKRVAGLTKALPSEVAEKAARTEQPRIGARSIRAQRKRLGLTVEKFAALLGASTASISNWESGRTKPAAGKRDRLLEVRGMSKAEAKEKLAEIGGAKKKTKAVRKKTAKKRKVSKKKKKKSA